MKRVVKTTLSLETPQSSALDHLWYDVAGRELFARYRGSQTISGYSDVSPLAVNKLLAASSIGQHFDKYIKKGGYTGINTDTVELLEPYEQPKPAPAFKATSWGNNVTPKKQTDAKRFKVTGFVLKPVKVEEYVMASSLEDAIVKFRENNADKEPQVESVSKA